jgi:DNA modification methylase
MGKVWLFNDDCLDALRGFPNESIHCCITSPPYWGLRDYGTATWVGGDPNCEHGVARWDGPKQTQGAQSGHSAERNRLNRTLCHCGAVRIDRQVGLEKAFSDYIAKLVLVFREVRRILRSDGTLWLNLGDSFSVGKAGRTDHGSGDPTSRLGPNRDGVPGGTPPGAVISRRSAEFKPKELMGMPWRVAFALQNDGWTLRSDIIWAKGNSLPESVTDRPTRCHEYVFLLTKSPRYFYDAEAIREPAVSTHGSGNGYKRSEQVSRGGRGSDTPYQPSAFKNRRSVWNINVKAYRGAHFAVFPDTLVEPCLFAGTSEHGCCIVCGTPYRRIVEKGEPDAEWQKLCGADSEGEYHGVATKDYASAGAQNASATKARILAGMRERKTVGWEKQCRCETDEVCPCTVLDPFAGSGTVGEVAIKHGRNAVLVELNASYCELIRDRVGRENVCN